MQIKRIQCPQCEVVLDVKNDSDSLEKKILCPNCRRELIVKFKPKADPIEAHTYYVRPKQPKPKQGSNETQYGGFGGSTSGCNHGEGNSDETQFGGAAAREETYARLILDDISYSLKEGRNVVGRRSEKHLATLEITTDDMSMSRQHVVITVTTLSDGKKKAVLSNYKNKNATLINDMPIDSGDAIRLADGNTITMGRTTLRFTM